MNYVNHSKVKSEILKSNFYNFFGKFFYNFFFFIYIKLFKNLSAKYCQQNKEMLQKKSSQKISKSL